MLLNRPIQVSVSAASIPKELVTAPPNDPSSPTGASPASPPAIAPATRIF